MVYGRWRFISVSQQLNFHLTHTLSLVEGTLVTTHSTMHIMLLPGMLFGSFFKVSNVHYSAGKIWCKYVFVLLIFSPYNKEYVFSVFENIGCWKVGTILIASVNVKILKIMYL
uniref:Uncharacterized protein n=1 Tax=Cacopsylla melanoneura TaxID=428564 RepID=A0A8D8VT15_9HEMI